MKKLIIVLFMTFISVFSFGQSEYDLFATPGLLSSQASGNIYIPGKSTHYFEKVEEKDSIKQIIYRNITTHAVNMLSAVGSKLYIGDLTFNNLFFDLSWTIGDTIKEGFYNQTLFKNISSITLANGEVRKMYELRGFGLYNNTQVFKFVPGIGDINYGLFPWTSFEGGSYLVCAKLGEVDLYVNSNASNQCVAEAFCYHPRIEFTYAESDKTITFTNLSKHCNEFVWEFGDGNTSSEVKPVHTYSQNGCYNVKLSGKDLCTTKVQNFKEITINLCSGISWKKEKGIDSLLVYTRCKITDKIEIVNNGKDHYKTTNGGETFFKLTRLDTEGKSRRVEKYLWWDELRGLALCNYQDAGTDQKSIFVTSDGGNTWKSEAPGSYNIADGTIDDQGKAWIACGQFKEFYYRTTDYGLTWEKIPLVNKTNFWSIKNFGSDTIYTHGTQGYISNIKYIMGRSYDAGSTWEFKPYNHGINSVSFISSKDGYTAYNSMLYQTKDGGETFQQKPTFFKASGVHTINSNAGFVTDHVGLIYYTNDGFNTFTTTNCNFKGIIFIGHLNDTVIYAVKTSDYSLKTFSIPLIFDISKLGCISVIDNDGDGFSTDFDCDDNNPNVNSSIIEIIYNGVDDDCNPLTLDDDLDSDGFNSNNDCNDNNSAINSSQIEFVYNGIDDDCNPLTLDDNLDGDGYNLEDDCNDMDANIYPGALEIGNNGIDENCDGSDLISSITQIQHDIINVIPNPFRSNINIHLNVDITELIILDINGNIVLVNGGLYTTIYNVNTLDWKSGLYIVRVKSKKGYMYKRMIKL